MWFNASGYILYDVGTYQPGRSTLGNDIAFRFATTQLKGVVMFTDVADDHVMVELLDGFLRVSWDLGQGKMTKSFIYTRMDVVCYVTPFCSLFITYMCFGEGGG